MSGDTKVETEAQAADSLVRLRGDTERADDGPMRGTANATKALNKSGTGGSSKRRPSTNAQHAHKPISLTSCVGIFASLLACFSLIGCASQQTGRADDRQSPKAKELPDHLCDSEIPTSPLRGMYPKGASGPVQMIRGNNDTGNIHHFMERKEESGNSVWGCWVQFDGSNAEESAFRASIVAMANVDPSSLDSLGRTAGYHAHSLSLGVIHGVNGPQHSVLDFPCQVAEHSKVTMRVIMLHPLETNATKAERKHMVRASAQYIRKLAHYVIDGLHLCKNIPKFPSGEFSSKPIPNA